MIKVDYGAHASTINGLGIDSYLKEYLELQAELNLEETSLLLTSANDRYYLFDEESEDDSYTVLTGFLPKLLKGKDWEMSFNSLISWWDEEYLEYSEGLREYQKKAVEKCLRKKRGLIKMPTGSGKTRTIAEIVNIFLSSGLTCLISVNTRSLLYQMRDDLVDAGINKNDVGLLGDGNRDITKKLVIGINDSLFNLSKKTQEYKRDLWILDEAHTLANPTGFGISSMLSSTYFRLGFSATPWSNNGMECILKGITGPLIYEYTEEEAMSEGFIMRPKVKLYLSPKAYAPSTLLSRPYSHTVYNKLYNMLIVSNKGRNEMIASLACDYMDKAEAPLAVIVSRVNTKNNHPDQLLPLIEKRGYKMPLLHGKTPRPIISDTIDKLKNFSISGAMFGPGILKEGVNIPCLGAVIIATAGSSDIAVLQRVGRVLRTDKDKEQPLIIDFIDSQSFFAKQSRVRQDLYINTYGSTSVEVVSNNVSSN